MHCLTKEIAAFKKDLALRVVNHTVELSEGGEEEGEEGAEEPGEAGAVTHPSQLTLGAGCVITSISAICGKPGLREEKSPAQSAGAAGMLRTLRFEG